MASSSVLDRHDRQRLPSALLWLPPIMVVAIAASLGALYRWHFAGDFSQDHATWGQFGDFLGGILNPVVGIVTLVAIVWSLYYSVRAIQLSSEALREQRQAERRNNTFQMLTVWLSEGMAHDRSVAWTWLHSLKEEARAEGRSMVFLGSFRKGHIDSADLLLVDGSDPRTAKETASANAQRNQRLYYSASNVYHFIVDVTTLVMNDAADEKLAKSLFQSSFRSWLELLEWTSRRASGDDTSPESEQVIRWFSDYVKPAFPLFFPAMALDDDGVARKAE